MKLVKFWRIKWKLVNLTIEIETGKILENKVETGKIIFDKWKNMK